MMARTQDQLMLLDDTTFSETSAPAFSDGMMSYQGWIHVKIEGDQNLPALLTYHDIGMNDVTCFKEFFELPEMEKILSNFCIYHLNAVGQAEGAATLPKNNFSYPTFDDMSNQILTIITEHSIKQFIGFGVGAGANILSRFALSYPDNVQGLILVNANSSASGLKNFLNAKLAVWNLRKFVPVSSTVRDFLLDHWLGPKCSRVNAIVEASYRDRISNINNINLSYFLEAYASRTSLGLVRELNPDKKMNVRNFRCNVMVLVGVYSSHYNCVVDMNGKIDPCFSNIVRLSCGGGIFEEEPNKTIDAIRNFLLGLGYGLLLRPPYSL